MMKDNEKLLDAIGNVSDEFVPDVLKATETTPVGKKRISFAPLAAVAAGAVMIGGAAIGIRELESDNEDAVSYSHFNESQEEYLDSNIDYSKLEILNPEIDFGTMGYEGYMVYDISELDSKNPYNPDIELESLPVYKNPCYIEGVSDAGLELCLSEEDLAQIAQEYAEKLGVEIKNTEAVLASDDTMDDLGEYGSMISSYTAICDGEKYNLETIVISISGDGTVCINFDPLWDDDENGFVLPENLSFTYSETSDEQAMETLEYFKSEFAQVIGFENPTAVSWGDRTYSGEKIRQYHFFESHNNYALDIIGHSFTNVEFCPDDYGNLMLIWISSRDLPLDGVQYPVISGEEAKELLCECTYISSVSSVYLEDGKITEDIIAKTEIVYVTNPANEYYMPFYKFYVKLQPTGDDGDLLHYGAFYVPAVSGEYLTEYPSADSTVIYGGC